MHEQGGGVVSDETPKQRLRIRGCFCEPPHASFAECIPENDAWMFAASNVPVEEDTPCASVGKDTDT